MLKARLLTAAVLIALVLSVLFTVTPSTGVMIIGAVVLFGLWEWGSLIGLKTMNTRVNYLLFSMLLLVLLIKYPIQWPLVMVAGLCWWVIALRYVLAYPQLKSDWFRASYLQVLIGWYVMLPCFAALSYLFVHPFGRGAILFLLTVVYGADAAAYFAGHRFGSKKLLPFVSPGKTQEGFWGAALAVLLVSLLAGPWLMPMLSWWQCVLLSLVVFLFSVLGDLTESMMKRAMGVKDSGHILPGHGGWLDRIDSLTAAAPVFVLGWLLIQNLTR